MARDLFLSAGSCPRRNSQGLSNSENFLLVIRIIRIDLEDVVSIPIDQVAVGFLSRSAITIPATSIDRARALTVTTSARHVRGRSERCMSIE
jgi:hypothetical protein